MIAEVQPRLCWERLLSVSFVFFWVWLAALVLAIWAVRIGQRFGVRLPRKIVAQREAEGYPRVAVILPIKGVDDDTHHNIRALLDQEYPGYRLIFVVESDEDPVVGLLEKIAQEESRVEIVVAGLSENRGQKVHNQLAGVERTTEGDEILAFMDADAKPGPHWLHNLIMPLTYGEHIGATTGYRYYIPVTPHTANKIVSVLNAMVGALLGPYRRTFAWGGSMAIRRKDFFGYGLHDLWQGALSDDYVLSYCVKNVAKRKIQFVAQCLVASDANFNWASLFEFAVRQYRITKVCAPWVWCTAVGGATLYLAAFTYTLFNVIYGFSFPHPLQGEHLRQMGMFASLYGISMLRGHLLVLGGQRMLPEHKNAIGSTKLWATIGLPWCYVINLVALVGSGFGRTIVWRGVTYRMVSRLKTEVERPRVGAVETRRAEVVET
jgi:cellulose synthase/poly-beta-1,6-N-acetylglucosamine synthase-like glycosyltransferase